MARPPIPPAGVDLAPRTEAYRAFLDEGRRVIIVLETGRPRAEVHSNKSGRGVLVSAGEARELADELAAGAFKLDPCQFGHTAELDADGRAWCNAHQRSCRFNPRGRIGAAGGPWANPESVAEQLKRHKRGPFGGDRG